MLPGITCGGTSTGPRLPAAQAARVGGLRQAPGHAPLVPSGPKGMAGGTSTGPRPPNVWVGEVVEVGKRATVSVPEDHRRMSSDPSPTRARRQDAVRRGSHKGEGGRVRQEPGPDPGKGVCVWRNPAGLTEIVTSQRRDPGSGATGRPAGPAREGQPIHTMST
jgi:hypothetical protein